MHRLARDHAAAFGGREVAVWSPQGRFAGGAALVDGRRLLGTEAYGKHLFHGYEGERWVHVHLGLYGKFSPGIAPAPEPRGAVRMRMQADGTYTRPAWPRGVRGARAGREAGRAGPAGPGPAAR